MGSCISKCSLSTSSPIHPNPPQDKLIISQSSTPPVPNHSSISSSQNSTATSHSYSSSKTKPIYSRGLISSPMKNRHIIILDPHKVNDPPIQGPCMLPFPKQQPQAPPAQPFPLKRERSSSPPPCPRQKSFRGEPKLPPAAPPPRRTSNSPSQARVMKAMVPPSNLVKCGPTIVDRGKVAMRRVHLVHSQQGKGGRMEDMDNPLISMECFIFL